MCMCVTHKLSQVTRGLELYSLKMLQQAFSIYFLVLSFMFSLLSVSTANSIVYVQCSQLNHTSMTPYESNVNSLSSSLVDSAAAYNFKKFETSPESDGVYGLFQCRGDLSSPNCKDCVASAISQLKTACPTSTGGEIQLEGCFVKYDNASFFGILDKMEVCKRCGPSIGYNSDALSRIDSAMTHLVVGNGDYFRWGDFERIQGVAQCVQDISLGDCQDCLSEAYGRLKSECETSSWGDMYMGKCYIRYAHQGTVNLANNGNYVSIRNSGGGSSVVDVASFVVSAVSMLAAVGSFYQANSADRRSTRAEGIVINLKVTTTEAKETATKAQKTANEAKKDAKDAKDQAICFIRNSYPPPPPPPPPPCRCSSCY